MKSWLAYLPSAGITVYTTTSFQLCLHHFSLLLSVCVLVCYWECSSWPPTVDRHAVFHWVFSLATSFSFFLGVGSSFSAAQADLEIHCNSTSVSQVLDYWYMPPCLSCTWWRSIYYLPKQTYPNQFGHIVPFPHLEFLTSCLCLISYRKTSVSLLLAVM